MDTFKYFVRQPGLPWSEVGRDEYDICAMRMAYWPDLMNWWAVAKVTSI